STTVTGTSTRWTLTFSVNFGCSAATAAAHTAARAMVMRLRERIGQILLCREECSRSPGDSVNVLFQCLESNASAAVSAKATPPAPPRMRHNLEHGISTHRRFRIGSNEAG